MLNASRLKNLTNKNLVWVATLLVIFGAGLIIGAWQLSSINNDEGNDLPDGVTELIPNEGARVLRQATVGIQLEGNEQYNIEVWLNGQKLTRGNRAPNRFTYRPDEDNQHQIGQNCLRAEFSPLTKPDATRQAAWCFIVDA